MSKCPVAECPNPVDPTAVAQFRIDGVFHAGSATDDILEANFCTKHLEMIEVGSIDHFRLAPQDTPATPVDYRAIARSRAPRRAE